MRVYSYFKWPVNSQSASSARFFQAISLPTAVNANKAEAAVENGVLTLRLPKAEEAKPKAITVKAK